MNISMFFLTGLVAQGYYFTIISLSIAGIIALGLIIPTTWVKRLWYFLIFVFFECAALYFLASSIEYWIRTTPRSPM